MSEQIDLGHFQFEVPSSGMSCTLSGHVSLKQLDERISNLFERSLSDRLTSFDAWLSAGGSVRMAVDTVLYDRPADQDFEMDVQRCLAQLLLESTVNLFARPRTSRD